MIWIIKIDKTNLIDTKIISPLLIRDTHCRIISFHLKNCIFFILYNTFCIFCKNFCKTVLYYDIFAYNKHTLINNSFYYCIVIFNFLIKKWIEHKTSIHSMILFWSINLLRWNDVPRDVSRISCLKLQHFLSFEYI